MKPAKILPLVLRQLFSQPATVSYPAGEKQFPDVRGKVYHDPELCIGCTACMRDCPAKAIEIIKVATEPVKRFEATIYLDRCVFCGQCVNGCPKRALRHSPEFELAVLNRDALKVLS